MKTDYVKTVYNWWLDDIGTDSSVMVECLLRDYTQMIEEKYNLKI